MDTIVCVRGSCSITLLYEISEMKSSGRLCNVVNVLCFFLYVMADSMFCKHLRATSVRASW